MNIFDHLNVRQQDRTPEYEQLLIHGDKTMIDGLQYGAGFYQGNELIMQQMRKRMSTEAVLLADWMAEELEEE